MARGEITIRVVKPPPNLSVTVMMDEEGCVITDGYGGWEIVERPRRTSITHWAGRESYQMEAHIVFDGYRDNDDVEGAITRLEKMALPYEKEPPPVLVLGSAVPHGGEQMDWVITNIEWGNKIRNNQGRRIRQHAKVTLRGFVALDRIQLKAAKRARKKAGRK
jgi:hypothetical protein